MVASRLARSRRSQAYGARATRVLEEGATCWRIRNASRATPLIDGAAYFDALRQALETARERVFIIGWDIRSDISLDPQGHQPPLAHYLRALVQRHRGLRIYILIWDWLLFFSLDRQLFPQYRFERFFGSQVRLVMDGNHPPGGCHHEKLVVVDDALAFCGGIDLAKGRWDRPQHHVNEPARGAYGDASLPPFHDLMLMVEGEVAASLDELARERWRRATGVRLGPPRRQARPPPWPQETPAWFENVPVGIARTRPKWGRQTAVREIGALLHAAIGAARRTIYIESQYFTVESIGQAIADKLAFDDGPEVVIIGPERCEGFVETAVMDVGRSRVLNRIRAADRHQRARIVTATVEENGRRAAINVHAKLLIVDDRLLIVGSANLANRSIGVDTECNLAIEADGRCAEQGIARTRTALLAEHLGVSEETLEREVEKRRSLVQAIDALNGGPRRLERLEVRTAALPEEIKESAALADPGEPITPQLIEERLAPPSRRRRLARISARFGLTVAGLGALALLLRSGMLGEGGSVELLESVEAYRSNPLGLAAATGVFIAASAAFVPVNLMIAATAAAFGPVAGLVCALAGALGAAGLLFAIGRGLGRDLVRRLAGRRMNAIDRRLAEQGVMAVVMLRLMPIAPFAAVNLIAGSTAVRARDFLLGTLIGMAPGIIVMTIFGDRLGAWLKRPDAENFWILAASVVAALGLIWAIRQWSRRRSAAEPAHAGGNL